MKLWLYICTAKTGRYYTGISTNPQSRLIKHNSGQGSWFAREQGPFELTWISKNYPNKSEARKREIQIKKWSRIKKEKLIKGEWK